MLLNINVNLGDQTITEKKTEGKGIVQLQVLCEKMYHFCFSYGCNVCNGDFSSNKVFYCALMITYFI